MFIFFIKSSLGEAYTNILGGGDQKNYIILMNNNHIEKDGNLFKILINNLDICNMYIFSVFLSLSNHPNYDINFV